MVDNQQESEGANPRYWKLFELGTGVIYAASIVTVLLVFHHPEWHDHLLRLTGRAWDVFVAQDVGSTSRGFLSGILEAFFGIAAVAAMTGYFLGWKELKKHWIETAIIALFAFPTVTFAVYGTQFAWEVAKLGYQDHSNLATIAAQSGQLNTQVGRLTNENSALEEKLAGKPTVITKTIAAPPVLSPTSAAIPTAAPIEKHCWFDNHFGMPNSTIKGAVTATAVILHCNYAVSAPLKVTVDFDRQFIPGALLILSGSAQFGGDWTMTGTRYTGQINSPSLLAEQLVVFTAYGPTDQYPRATDGKIETAQSR